MAERTRDHTIIQVWAEERGGRPGRLRPGVEGFGPSRLRIYFPDEQRAAEVEEISWEAFFDAFEKENLVFCYRETLRSGARSRFCKMLPRPERRAEKPGLRGKLERWGQSVNQVGQHWAERTGASHWPETIKNSQTAARAKSWALDLAQKAGSLTSSVTGTLRQLGQRASEMPQVHRVVDAVRARTQAVVQRRAEEGDVLALLQSQHQEAEQLFGRLHRKSDQDDRRLLFLQLSDLLATHTAIEEQIFYPALRAPVLAGTLDTYLHDHDEVKQTLAELLRKGISDPGFDGKLEELEAAVEEHVQEEERSLFPKVRALMDDQQLHAMARDMRRIMAELRREGEPREQVLQEAPEHADRPQHHGEHGHA